MQQLMIQRQGHTHEFRQSYGGFQVEERGEERVASPPALLCIVGTLSSQLLTI